MPKLRIAIIGAGSVGFTRKLFSDIVAVPEPREAEFALTDIDPRNPASRSSRSIADAKMTADSTHIAVGAALVRISRGNWTACMASSRNGKLDA